MAIPLGGAEAAGQGCATAGVPGASTWGTTQLLGMVLGRCRRGKNAQCTGTARRHSWVPVLLFLPQAAAQHPLSAHPQPKGFRKIGCTLLYFTFPSLPLLNPSRPAHPSPHGCRAVPRGCSQVLRPQGTRTQIFPSPGRMQHERLFFPLQTTRTRLSSSPDNEDIQQTCLLLVSLLGEPKGSRQHLCRALYSDGERNAGCPGELVMRAGRIRQKHTMGWLQQGASTRQRVPALRRVSTAMPLLLSLGCPHPRGRCRTHGAALVTLALTPEMAFIKTQ